MNYTVKHKKGFSIVETPKELNVSVATSLKVELIVMSTAGIKNIIFNLKETTYCDSSGLSAILTARRSCLRLGGLCLLVHVQEPVEKFIKIISQVDLNIYKDLQEAKNKIYKNPENWDNDNFN